MSQQQNNDMQQHFYRASAADFGKIPGSPVAYWVSSQLCNNFSQSQKIGSSAKKGLSCSGTEQFYRFSWEVSKNKISVFNGNKWYPITKGGSFRKWYGNNENFINWENNGSEIKLRTDHVGKQLAVIRNEEHYFKECTSWNDVSSGSLASRFTPAGSIPTDSGPAIYSSNHTDSLALLNSCVAMSFAELLCPTIHFSVGQIAEFPLIINNRDLIDANIYKLIDYARLDWDACETSWNFTLFPLINKRHHHSLLAANYQAINAYWRRLTSEMQRLEEENNRLFIEAYGLQDELTPEVPLSEITLTCNPHYRYGGNLTDEEREARLQSDTIAELISYAIGCMMGRYSLDREGLVYAHAGNEGFKALEEEGAYTSFAADDDGILPLTSENWFSDDVAARIEAFVATVWGKESLEENLSFIADSLNLYAVKPVKKGGETARETIRRYLSSQFYKDHLKTYKKRPIYWLFSSGKEKAFECLVYLHRYNESTLPRMRTEYVTPLLGQIDRKSVV